MKNQIFAFLLPAFLLVHILVRFGYTTDILVLSDVNLQSTESAINEIALLNELEEMETAIVYKDFDLAFND